MIWGSSADLSSMNPQMSTQFVDVAFQGMMYGQLVELDLAGKLGPAWPPNGSC
jgi:hypothetical protein